MMGVVKDSVPAQEHRIFLRSPLLEVVREGPRLRAGVFLRPGIATKSGTGLHKVDPPRFMNFFSRQRDSSPLLLHAERGRAFAPPASVISLTLRRK